jgi:hypothetical protein
LSDKVEEKENLKQVKAKVLLDITLCPVPFDSLPAMKPDLNSTNPIFLQTWAGLSLPPVGSSQFVVSS